MAIILGHSFSELFWINDWLLYRKAVGTIMVFGIGMIQKGGFSQIRIVLAGAAVSAFLYAASRGCWHLL